MVRGTLANVHQGCAIFAPYNGVQCTAMALISLLAFFQFSNLPNVSFSPEDIDIILQEGNCLYSQIANEIGAIRYLGHSDLPSHVGFQGGDYEIQYLRDVYFGTIDRTVNNLFGQTCFYEAIAQTSLLTPFHLITLNELTISIYVSVDNNQFFIFDSHERDANGRPRANGAAVILQFDSFDELVLYIFSGYSSFYYELTPIFIEGNCAENDLIEMCQQSFSDLSNQTSDLSFANRAITSSKHSDFQSVSSHTSDRLVEQAKTFTNVDLTNAQHSNCQSVPTEENIQNQSLINCVPTPGKNHSYTLPFARKKKKSPKLPVLYEGVAINFRNNVSQLESSFCMLDVGNVCEIGTSVNLSFVDYVEQVNHVSEYEKYIRLQPNYQCVSCHRFLFENQINYIRKSSRVLVELGFTTPCLVCSSCFTCLRKGNIPSIAYYRNMLDPGEQIPCLQCLSNLERRLIAKINIFMTVVMLPGGQYAERGLVLNLPSNSLEVISQLPLAASNFPYVVVCFDSGSSTASAVQSNGVSVQRIQQALVWLKHNNKLYHDLVLQFQDVYSVEVDSGSTCSDKILALTFRSSGNLNISSGKTSTCHCQF